jgi:hypothetical protein
LGFFGWVFLGGFFNANPDRNWNRNYNFSKVGTGTITFQKSEPLKNSYGSTTLLLKGVPGPEEAHAAGRGGCGGARAGEPCAASQRRPDRGAGERAARGWNGRRTFSEERAQERRT